MVSSKGEDEINDDLDQAFFTVHISLQYCGLTSIPERVFASTQLVSLNISDAYIVDGIGSLDRQIGKLKELRRLKMESVGLTSIPSSITKLKHLRNLDLNSNAQLKSIPKMIHRLASLSSINISRTGIKKLPAHFGRLHNLQTFIAYHTPLETLPELYDSQLTNVELRRTRLSEIPQSWLHRRLKTFICSDCGQLVDFPDMSQTLNLQVLDVSGCALRSQPSGMQSCIRLKHINFLGNNINDLTSDTEYFESLITIDLSYCPIRTVPQYLRSLPRLQHVIMDNTFITQLPAWVKHTTWATFSANYSNLNEILTDGYRRVVASDVAVSYVGTPLELDEFAAPLLNMRLDYSEEDEEFIFDSDDTREPPRQRRRRSSEVCREELASSPTMAALLYAPGADDILQLRGRAISRGT